MISDQTKIPWSFSVNKVLSVFRYPSTSGGFVLAGDSDGYELWPRLYLAHLRYAPSHKRQRCTSHGYLGTQAHGFDSAKALSAGPASCCKPRCGAHGIRLPWHANEVVGRNTPKGHSALRGPAKVFDMTFPVCDPRCNALWVLHPCIIPSVRLCSDSDGLVLQASG